MVAGSALTSSRKTAQPNSMNNNAAIAAGIYQRATGRVSNPGFMIDLPLFVRSEPLFPTRAFGERDGIEDGRALVAKDRKSAADGAGRLVVAVAAGRIIVDARA